MRKLTDIIGHEGLDGRIKLLHDAIILLSEYESLGMTPQEIRGKLKELEEYKESSAI